MGSNSSCKPCDSIRPSSKSQFHQSSIIEVYSNNFFIKGRLNFNKQSTFKKLEIAANQLCMSSGIGIQYAPVVMRLLAFEHQNVFHAFSTLKTSGRVDFMDKLSEIYLDLMDSLYQFLILKKDKVRILSQLKKGNLKPFDALHVNNIKIEDKLDLINQGVGLLHGSKVAIVFMCSGASSRFFFQDKFLYPFLIHNRQTTILKILFQKLRQNYRQKSEDEIINIPIVLMGNETNTDSIEFYLKQNDFFNFDQRNIYFSSIPSLPILDEKGKICLNFQYNYLRRPKGSACCLEQILSPQAANLLKEKQVEYLHVIGTQNIGQSPGDPLFLGLTHMLQRKVSIKCTSVTEPFQNFDRLIDYHNGKVRIFDRSSLEQISQPQLFQSDIAMNSMIFALDQLPNLVQKFNHDLQLAGLYRALDMKENVYDFNQMKPMINQKCWAFQKNIKDTIWCAQKPFVLKVDRKEFIPIISSKKQYSVSQAVEKYIKQHPQKKSFQFKNPLRYSAISKTTSEQDLKKSFKNGIQNSAT